MKKSEKSQAFLKKKMEIGSQFFSETVAQKYSRKTSYTLYIHSGNGIII